MVKLENWEAQFNRLLQQKPGRRGRSKAETPPKVPTKANRKLAKAKEGVK